MTEMEKVMQNTLSFEELTGNELLSADDSPGYIYDHCIEEALESHYNDYPIDELKVIGLPNVYVFKKDKPFQYNADMIFDVFEQNVCESDADNFDFKKVNELLIPLNNYLKEVSNTYSIIGRIKDDDVKPVWEKLKKEWLNA